MLYLLAIILLFSTFQTLADATLVIQNDTTSFNSSELPSRPISPSDTAEQPGGVVISNMEMVDDIEQMNTFIQEVGEMKKETQNVTTKKLSNGQQVEVYVSDML